MNEKEILRNTENYIREKLEGDSSGHDWWHIYRVRNLARYIAKHEGANLFVVEASSLLHDIADWKFHDGDLSIGPRLAREWLESQEVVEYNIAHICNIIEDGSFKGAKVESKMKTLEGMVFQDADRLDAIGAIGIARTFAYGGHNGNTIYVPDLAPEIHESFEQYQKGGKTTINHFYEKLLLIKDLMNTETAKKIAENRHQYMVQYLNQFFAEWDGKDYS